MSKREQQVANFNKKILGITECQLGMMQTNDIKLSLAQLREEVDELEESYDQKDFIGVLDALIDMEYFLLGVMFKHGIDSVLHEQLFDVVHTCNMLKRRGEKSTRAGFNGAADAIKPLEWQNPTMHIARIIDEARKVNNSRRI